MRNLSIVIRNRSAVERRILVKALVEELQQYGSVFGEYRFCHERRWRFDWALPDVRFAVEIQGIGPGGRHGKFSGLEGDCEKYAEAMALGWRVLQVTHKQIRDGRAAAWVKRILQAGKSVELHLGATTLPQNAC